MSFGGVALPPQASSSSSSSSSSSTTSSSTTATATSASPSSSSSGGGVIEERSAAGNPVSGAPVPPVPPPNFSSNFTFQGGPAPQSIPRPFAAPSSSNFSFPGPSPSPSQAPPRLPFIAAAAPPTFSYHQASPPGQIHARPPTPQLPIAGAQPPSLPNGPPLLNQALNQSQPPPAMEASLSSVAVSAPPASQASASKVGPSPIASASAGVVLGGVAEEPHQPAVRPMIPPPMQSLPQGQQVAPVPAAAAASTIVPARPLAPLPTPQYRAPFTANPAVSMVPPGDMRVSIHMSFFHAIRRPMAPTL